jgi:hypothetical protein
MGDIEKVIMKDHPSITIEAKGLCNGYNKPKKRKSQLLIRNGEGENYNYSQDHCFIKLSSRQTNGELCLIEDTLKPGFH